MEKQIERRITLQPYRPVSHLSLTSFPIGNLRNPGIGTKIYDIMLPLYGQERFEVKKKEITIPGSFEETPKLDFTQEGFGLKSNNDDVLKEKLNDTEKVKKLGEVFSAMQHASIRTSSYNFEPKPKENKAIKTTVKKSSKRHKFTFV